MPEIVVAVARAAAHFSRRGVDHRNHRMVHDSLAADAKIVDIVTQADIAHKRSPN